jgi:transposase InsO family protein
MASGTRKENKSKGLSPVVNHAKTTPHIFEDKDYEEWRIRLVTALTREGVRGVLKNDANEEKYLDLSEEEREVQMNDYVQLQEVAQSILFERLQNKHLRLVRNEVTFKQMLDRLDQKYRITSKIGLATARDDFQRFKYQGNGDMSKFIDIFDVKANRYEEAGGELTDDDKALQLSISIPREYDSVTDWYESLSEEMQTYDNYKKKVIEKFERLQLHERNEKKSYQRSKGGFPNEARSETPRSETRSCYRCGEKGHIAPNCPKNEKKSSNTERKELPNSKEYTPSSNKKDVPRFEKKPPHTFMCVASENDEENDDTQEFEMMLDCGANYHMIRELYRLSNVVILRTAKKVESAESPDGLEATHQGDLKFQMQTRRNEWTNITLTNVLYVPNLRRDLLSAERIVSSGKYRIDYQRDFADVLVCETKELVCSAITRKDGKFFNVRQTFDDPIAFTAHAKPKDDDSERQRTSMLIHRRLGHPSSKVMQRLPLHVEGLPPNFRVKDDDFRDCDVCLRAKSVKLPHNTTRRRSIRILEMVSSDILGPLPRTEKEERYILTFLDNFSNWAVIYVLKERSEVVKCFADYHKKVSAHFPDNPIAEIRCDNAKEYILGDMRRYLDAAGITIDSGESYCPQLNARAERFNQTLCMKMRCLILDSAIPPINWPEIAKAAVHIINRLPTKSNVNFQTPFELWHQRKPTLQYMKVFGCIAYEHIPEETRRRETGDPKFGARAKKFINLGSYGNTGYRLLNPETNSVSTSRDVRFIESKNYFDYQHERDLDNRNAITDHDYAMALVATASDSKDQDEFHEFIPQTYADAIHCKFSRKWVEAMDDELEAIRQKKVWHEVVREDKMNIIDTKWIYSLKYGEDGEPRAKARLVARGFKDKNSYEMFETYAPVAPMTAIRWLLSTAQKYGLQLTQIDVKTAFLNGKLQEEIYIQIPDGVHGDRKKTALKLERALYGLKTASKSWYRTLKNVIKQLGYENSNAETSVYYKNS